jgi:WD40 repeat protein
VGEVTALSLCESEGECRSSALEGCGLASRGIANRPRTEPAWRPANDSAAGSLLAALMVPEIMPLKQCFRTLMFWWALAGFAVAVLAATWPWVPPSPRLVIDVDEGSYFLGFSPDGALLAIQRPELWNGWQLNWAGPIQLWSLATGKKVGTLPRRNLEKELPCWSARNGNILIHVMAQKSASRPEARNSTELPWAWKNGSWSRLSTSGDALDVRTLIEPVSAGDVWDGFSDRVGGESAGLNNISSKPPDHQLFAARTLDVDLILWDAAQRRVHANLGNISPIFAVFSPDGQTLAVENGNTDDVNLFDVTSGQKRATFTGGHAPVFVPSSRNVATFYPDPVEDWCVKIWDSDTGQETNRIRINPSRYNCCREHLQASPDGKTLAVSAQYASEPNWIINQVPSWSWLQWVIDTCFRRLYLTRMLKLFDIGTGEELVTLPAAHCHWFSPDGRLFATMWPQESKLRIWEVPAPSLKSWRLFAIGFALVWTTPVLARWWWRRGRNQQHQ